MNARCACGWIADVPEDYDPTEHLTDPQHHEGLRLRMDLQAAVYWPGTEGTG